AVSASARRSRRGAAMQPGYWRRDSVPLVHGPARPRNKDAWPEGLTPERGLSRVALERRRPLSRHRGRHAFARRGVAEANWGTARLVYLQLEDVRPGVVAHRIEVEAGTSDFA